jgi:hypothetical protein
LAPRDSPQADQAGLSLNALAQAAWLERTGCEAAPLLWNRLFPHGDAPRVSHRGHNIGHLQYMASAGLGLMLWPEHAPHLETLVTRPIENDPLRRSIQLRIVQGRRYSPALEALLKISRLHDWSAAFPKPDTTVAPTGLGTGKVFETTGQRQVTA